MKKANNDKNSKNMPLLAAGVIFAILAIIQLIRYIKGWILVISTHIIPVHFSLYAAIIMAVLSLWMFWASRQ